MGISATTSERFYVSRPKNAEEREQVFSEVVETYRDRLRSFVRNRIQDQNETEDVLQEVFEEFLEAYDVGKAIETLGSWLLRVAQNKIIDRFRRRKVQNDYKDAQMNEP